MNRKNNSVVGSMVEEKSGFLYDLGNFFKHNYKIILLIFFGFVAISVLNFLNVATSQTIASYNLSDFEIGQISDRTILAPRSISPDEMNPVSIEEGEKIIRKGFPITEEAFSKLKKMAESPVYLDLRAFSNSELYMALVVIMWFIFFAYTPFNRKMLIREFVFQTICFLCVYAAVAFGGKASFASSSFVLLILIPAELFILIEAILYGTLSAMFFSIILAFGVFDASSFHIIPFLYTLITCIASSIIVRKIEKRIHMIFVATILSFINVVSVIALSVIFNEKCSNLPVIIGGVAGNGFLSGILALALVTPIEIMLNTASVFRMMDLSDTNVPILKKLFLTAGGTYQHSQMVGQLAETACRDIGANALIAKVGAWYHDIGKIDQSEYFAENVPSGTPSKHDELSPNLSASILRSHVRKGVEKARQLHLPQVVIDIIEEHHGSSLIAFFYDKALKLDENTNAADYSYPGNPPKSKESAVVMLADTVEAASRTLDNPTEERLQKFIEGLVAKKIESGQLDYCGLTFSDISKVKNAFVKMLVGVYHNRVKYPNQKDPSENVDAGEKSVKKAEKDKTDEKVLGKIEMEAKTTATRKAVVKNDTVLGEKTLTEVRLNG